MTGPMRPSHTPLTDSELEMINTDSRLSQIMQDALDNKDIGTLVEAIAEKRSIERALHMSRWSPFNYRMDREFFGGDV